MMVERYGILLLAVLPAFVGGCKILDEGINVNLETPEPIKIDITMKVEVKKVDDLLEDEEVPLNLQAARKRIDDRAEEIQTLKNSRIVGENHEGLLEIRSPPAGDYGDYVEKTVKAENVDRRFLMASAADEDGEVIEDVKRRKWEQRTSASFEDEWIEVEGDEPGTYRWEKKKR